MTRQKHLTLIEFFSVNYQRQIWIESVEHNTPNKRIFRKRPLDSYLNI